MSNHIICKCQQRPTFSAFNIQSNSVLVSCNFPIGYPELFELTWALPLTVMTFRCFVAEQSIFTTENKTKNTYN